jgi:hypothetical protein
MPGPQPRQAGPFSTPKPRQTHETKPVARQKKRAFSTAWPFISGKKTDFYGFHADS